MKQVIAVLSLVAVLASSCGGDASPDSQASSAEPTTSSDTADVAEGGTPSSDTPAPNDGPEDNPSEADTPTGDTPEPADAPEDDDPEDDDSEADAPSSDTPANWTTGASLYIFDQTRLHTFELSVPEESLAEIDADPAAEEWVEATLRFEGEDVGAVGLRYKGSIGAFVNCLSGNDPLRPSGAKTCTKLSMKVKINWEGRDETFFGLKKLQFHSMNHDQSQMRERLGYWLFREMGVAAPRSVHARVVINGEFVGLFALTEQIDGRFARQNFEDGKGNVYKEVWPLNESGQPHADRVYLDALETNEDEDPSVAVIRTFAEELAGATSTDELRAVIARRMVVQEAIAYAVVDRSIRHDDGPFHWYCFGPTGCAPHNFYWYENPTEKTLHLIPWDLDNAFENLAFNSNPITPIADDWGETSNECAPFVEDGTFVPQRSAACDPLVAGWASFEIEYDQLMAHFLAGPGEPELIEELITLWSAQITDATAEASAAHGDAVSVDTWKRSVDRLLLDFAAANAG